MSHVAGAAIVGFFGYGVRLGAFRPGATPPGDRADRRLFLDRPVLGAALALFLFNEPVTAQLVGAAVLMSIGIYLHLSERHEHEHGHEAMDHEHHQHVHAGDDPAGEPHTHRHHHAPMRHKHPHDPDLHHRHGHAH